MDRDSGALQLCPYLSPPMTPPAAVQLMDSVLLCCLIWLLSLFCILSSYLSVLKAALSFHLTALPQSNFYHSLISFFFLAISLLKLSNNLSLLSYPF